MNLMSIRLLEIKKKLQGDSSELLKEVSQDDSPTH